MSRTAKVKALAARPGTDGEKQAAEAALARLPIEQPIGQPDRKRLTAKVVASLPVPTSGYKLYRDAANESGKDLIRGFAVRVTARGTKAFVMHVVANGTERRVTIGTWPSWAVEEARKEAKKIAAKAELGDDPAEQRREERGRQTVNQLADMFLQDHVAFKRPETIAQYRDIVKRVLRPTLGRRQIKTIEQVDIRRLHHTISARGAAFMANRVLSVASIMFKFAMKRGLCTGNPAADIERNEEPHRERYLTEPELQRLHTALTAHEDQNFADLVRLLLLTGSRLGETLRAEWSDVNLGTATWVKPVTKQKRRHTVRLSPRALKVLQDLDDRRRPGAVKVFNLTKRQVRYRFERLLEAAEITSFRKHDLRHSYASAVLSKGYDLNVIGKLLGHSNPAVTQRYAHLRDDILQQAAAAAGDALAATDSREKSV
jgi:integrase